MKLSVVCLLAVGWGLGLAAAPLSAADPYLVADVDPIAEPASSSPAEFVTLGRRAVFAATDEAGRELWSSDGTPGGTQRILDACPGACSSRPLFIASSPSWAIYLLEYGQTGHGDLWVTRGVAGDALKIASGVSPQQSPVWVEERQRLFFVAASQQTGRELWVSDGTAAGTRPLELNPGKGDAGITTWIAHRGRLALVADADGKGPTLWISDGTSAGTRAVRRLGGPDVRGTSSLLSLGGWLVFFAPAPGKGFELWRSDGTAVGTQLLLDIAKGTASTYVWSGAAIGSRAFFILETPGAGQQLWVTDGRPAGTRALTAFARKDAFTFSDPPQVVRLGSSNVASGRLFFVANDGVHGLEPWSTDGTAAGTRMVRDTCPGGCSGFGVPLGAVGARMMLRVYTAQLGSEPWMSDGTVAGTNLLADLCAGSCDSFPFGYPLLRGGRRLLLAGPFDARELWVTDGTGPGTTQLTDFRHPSFGYPLVFQTVVGGRLLFLGTGMEGAEPWISDGTRAGTHLLADVADIDQGGSFPSDLVAAGETVYFFVGEFGDQLWRSDGSAAGTEPVAGPLPRSYQPVAPLGEQLVYGVSEPGRSSLWITEQANAVRLLDDMSQIREIAVSGGRAFCAAVTRGNAWGLWVSDGSSAGTALLHDFGGGYVGELTAFHGQVYFAAVPAGGQAGLWRSDGTAAGTFQVFSLELGPVSLTAESDGLYFFADRDLWRTDGTSAGTSRVGRFEVSDPSRGWLARVGPWLLGLFQDGLWVTDGTVQGSRRLAEARLDSGQSPEERPVLLGGRLFFPAIDPVLGVPVLYTSDGTKAGTHALPDRDAKAIREPSSLQLFAGRLVFATRAAERGDLWESDGTATGTRRLPVIGSRYQGAYPMVVAGPRLFFAAADATHGTELWALPATERAQRQRKARPSSNRSAPATGTSP